MKPWRDRIRETIAFIKEAPVFSHQNKRAAIANLIERRNLTTPITEVESVAMAQGGTSSTGNRNFRRALILIRITLLNETPTFASTFVRAIPDPNLSASLSTILNTIYQAKQAELVQAVNSLRATPANFLAVNKIQVMTSSTSGLMQFGLYFDADNNRYAMQAIANVAPMFVCTPVQVYHIHVQRWTTVQGNLAAIVGCEIGGAADLAVTTQLTGCSVLYELNDDHSSMLAAHVQPTGTTGPLLCQAMRAGASFSNPIEGGTNGVFGAVDVAEQGGYVMSAGACYFIGVRVNGAWELHAQQYAVGAPLAVPRTWQII